MKKCPEEDMTQLKGTYGGELRKGGGVFTYTPCVYLCPLLPLYPTLYTTVGKYKV